MDYLIRLEVDSGQKYPLAHRINEIALADLLGPGVWLPGREEFYDVLGDVEHNAGIDVSLLRRLDDSRLRPHPPSPQTRHRDGYVLGPESWQNPMEMALCLQSVVSCLQSHPAFIAYDFHGTVSERTVELLRDVIGQCLWAAELKSRVRFTFSAHPSP